MSESRDEKNRKILIEHMNDEELKRILLEQVKKAQGTPELQNALNKYLAGEELSDEEDATIIKYSREIKYLLASTGYVERSRRNRNGTTNITNAHKAYNAIGQGWFSKQ